MDRYYETLAFAGLVVGVVDLWHEATPADAARSALVWMAIAVGLGWLARRFDAVASVAVAVTWAMHSRPWW